MQQKLLLASTSSDREYFTRLSIQIAQLNNLRHNASLLVIEVIWEFLWEEEQQPSGKSIHISAYINFCKSTLRERKSYSLLTGKFLRKNIRKSIKWRRGVLNIIKNWRTELGCMRGASWLIYIKRIENCAVTENFRCVYSKVPVTL